MASLENYPFLTPSVEIKKVIFNGVPPVAILDRFPKVAAVQTRWSRRLRGVASPKTDLTRSRNGLRGNLS